MDPPLKTPFEWALLTKMLKYLVPCAPRKQNLAEIVFQSPFIKYTFHFNNRQQFRSFVTLQNSMPYKQNFLNWISTARPSPHFLYITEHPKQGTKFWQQIVYTWKSYSLIGISTSKTNSKVSRVVLRGQSFRGRVACEPNWTQGCRNSNKKIYSKNERSFHWVILHNSS